MRRSCLCTILVRGDLADLLLYEREGAPPDKYDDFLAPYRSVKDFKLRRLSGGANMLKTMICASLRSRTVPYDDSSKTALDSEDDSRYGITLLSPQTELHHGQLFQIGTHKGHAIVAIGVLGDKPTHSHGQLQGQQAEPGGLDDLQLDNTGPQEEDWDDVACRDLESIEFVDASLTISWGGTNRPAVTIELASQKNRRLIKKMLSSNAPIYLTHIGSVLIKQIAETPQSSTQSETSHESGGSGHLLSLDSWPTRDCSDLVQQVDDARRKKTSARLREIGSKVEVDNGTPKWEPGGYRLRFGGLSDELIDCDIRLGQGTYQRQMAAVAFNFSFSDEERSSDPGEQTAGHEQRPLVEIHHEIVDRLLEGLSQPGPHDEGGVTLAKDMLVRVCGYRRCDEEACSANISGESATDGPRQVSSPEESKSPVRPSRAAFWQVKRRGETTSEDKVKVFRLYDAQGYFDTNQPAGSSDDSASDNHFERHYTADRPEGQTGLNYLAFVDLGFGYTSEAFASEWYPDLVSLERGSPSSEDNFIVGIIGRTLPRITEDSERLQKLFQHHVLATLNSLKKLPVLRSRFHLDGAIATLDPRERGDDSAKPPRGALVWEGQRFRVTWVVENSEECELTASLGDTRVKLVVKHKNPSGSSRYLAFRVDFACGVRLPSYSLWDYLHTFFRRRTLLIVSAQLLRAHGMRISHRISWERTAQDCIAALKVSPLRQLAEFGHLVIRIGVTGAVHVYRDRLSMDRGRQLYYDPVGHRGEGGAGADAFFRDASEMGRVLGSNSVFCGSIIAAIIEGNFSGGDVVLGVDQPLVAERIGNGIRRAIRGVQRQYRCGYGTPADQKTDPPRWGFDCETERDATSSNSRSDDDRFMLKYPLDDFLSEPLGGRSGISIGCANILHTPRWSLLREAAGGNLYRLACKIAVRGLDASLNVNSTSCVSPSPSDDEASEGAPGPIVAPVVYFDQLVSVDREEIESLRNIDVILRAYHKDLERKKPVSIAVFGPPGSGKSFGVQCVAKAIFGKEVEFHNCNLAQLSDPKDLAATFLRASDSKDKILVLFIDEFDCSLNKEALGWLRYFLAPMEDGEYRHGEQIFHLPKRTLLVFAGGVSQSFEAFAGQGGDSSPEKRLEFARAKGPDFVSRLAGHMNMIGINRRDGNDEGYIIRRAIQLRDVIQRRKLIGPRGIAMIAPPLIEALLRVPHYKHGSRSLRIVLETCVGEDGKLWLPTLPQLEMHVNAEQMMEQYENALRYPTIRQTQHDGLIVELRHSY